MNAPRVPRHLFNRVTFLLDKVCKAYQKLGIEATKFVDILIHREFARAPICILDDKTAEVLLVDKHDSLWVIPDIQGTWRHLGYLMSLHGVASDIKTGYDLPVHLIFFIDILWKCLSLLQHCLDDDLEVLVREVKSLPENL